MLTLRIVIIFYLKVGNSASEYRYLRSRYILYRSSEIDLMQDSLGSTFDHAAPYTRIHWLIKFYRPAAVAVERWSLNFRASR